MCRFDRRLDWSRYLDLPVLNPPLTPNPLPVAQEEVADVSTDVRSLTSGKLPLSLLRLACAYPTPPPAAIEAEDFCDDCDGDKFERDYKQIALEEYADVSSDGGSFTRDESPVPREVSTLIDPISMELSRPTHTLVHKEKKARVRNVSLKTIRTTARRPHLPPRREATLTEVGTTGRPVDGKPLDVAEYAFRNPPEPPAEVGQQPAHVKMTPLGLGTRYKTHDMDLFAPEYKTYAESSGEVRTRMERDAVIANVLRRNQRKICEERGIPPDVFSRIWEEYRESNTYQGKFFHREEIVRKEVKDNTLRMQAVLAAYKEHEAKGIMIL